MEKRFNRKLTLAQALEKAAAQMAEQTDNAPVDKDAAVGGSDDAVNHEGGTASSYVEDDSQGADNNQDYENAAAVNEDAYATSEVGADAAGAETSEDTRSVEDKTYQQLRQERDAAVGRVKPLQKLNTALQHELGNANKRIEMLEAENAQLKAKSNTGLAVGGSPEHEYSDVIQQVIHDNPDLDEDYIRVVADLFSKMSGMNNAHKVAKEAENAVQEYNHGSKMQSLLTDSRRNIAMLPSLSKDENFSAWVQQDENLSLLLTRFVNENTPAHEMDAIAVQLDQYIDIWYNQSPSYAAKSAPAVPVRKPAPAVSRHNTRGVSPTQGTLTPESFNQQRSEIMRRLRSTRNPAEQAELNKALDELYSRAANLND